MLNPSVFHDYDIRGVYGKELDEEGFYRVGCALATYLQVDEIAVGRDMRVSGPGLLEALIEGITDMGTNVVNLGLISTEIQYFASGEYEYPANAIVSASHNPPEYNGLKIVEKGAIPLHGNYGLPEIKELAVKNEFTKAETKGTVTERDIFDAWIEHCLKFIDLDVLKNMNKTMKIVVDAGNGMAGPTWNAIKDHLPNIDIVPLYFEPDGTFPNHQPDPIKPQNIVLAQAAIKEHNADFCIALDGDADRAFIIDENADFVPGTIVTAILADEFLTREPGKMVIYNVNVGKIVPEVVKQHGGTPMRVRVGHSFIKTYMRENDAIFAGNTPVTSTSATTGTLTVPRLPGLPSLSTWQSRMVHSHRLPSALTSISPAARSTSGCPAQQMRQLTSSRNCTRMRQPTRLTACPSGTMTGGSSCGHPRQSRCCG